MSGEPSRLPRIFLLASARRSLLALALLAGLSGLAMLPAMATMSRHGASLFEFESAGSVARSQAILAEWGGAGKDAMWWQLALDLPFIAGYSFLLAGACAAVVGRARSVGRPGLARMGTFVAWFGPVAGAADLLQNVALGLVLGGAKGQPWPRISAVAGTLTTVLAILAALFAAGGFLATRGARRELRPGRP
jgi:hypothetical protein